MAVAWLELLLCMFGAPAAGSEEVAGEAPGWGASRGARAFCNAMSEAGLPSPGQVRERLAAA